MTEEVSEMPDRTLDQRLQTMRRIADVVNAFTSPEVQKLAFEALADTLDDPGPSVPAGPAPEILTRALAAFDDAGDVRLHSDVLAQALEIDSVTELAEQLRPHGVKPLPAAFTRRGVRRRGYVRADIVEALKRFTI